MTTRIGTAGWSLPKPLAGLFPDQGTHLNKYASRFNAVEINSSFNKTHRPDTYEKWAAEVPDDFQFSVKLSREFTHDLRFDVPKTKLTENLEGPKRLGRKWAVLLVQLPPSFAFDEKRATGFFSDLRDVYDGRIVLEPRHLSWKAAGSLMNKLNIQKVMADPEPCNWTFPDQKFVYHRWHGTPVIYKSRYSIERLTQLANHLKPDSWVIFDNTTYGDAYLNAFELQNILNPTSASESLLTSDPLNNPPPAR